MTDTMWGVFALAGLGVVVIGNALRARRTNNAGCMGHLFVKAQDMTAVELVLNRSGIVMFMVGVVLNIAL